MYELVGSVSAQGSDNDGLLCGLDQCLGVETVHLARGPFKDETAVGARSIPDSVSGASYESLLLLSHARVVALSQQPFRSDGQNDKTDHRNSSSGSSGSGSGLSGG